MSGAVKPSEVGHDLALYRRGSLAQAPMETAGGSVTPVRIDAELKGGGTARGA